MKKTAIIILCIIALSACGTSSQKQQVNSVAEQSASGDSIESSELMAHVHGVEVSFFGEPLLLGDSLYVMQQIKGIAESDDRLSVEGRVLTVGNVGFGINIHDGFLSLISSVQVDDPEMGKVMEYLDSLYGTAEVNENYYWWYVGADGEYRGRLVARMRPLHSEEGGTVIFFEETWRKHQAD